MWLAQHLKTQKERILYQLFLAIMRIYKTCNSVVVMGTFSIHNLLKYNIIVLCVCVCAHARACVRGCARGCVRVCVHAVFFTNICMYNKSYFRASYLITLVEELNTAPVMFRRGCGMLLELRNQTHQCSGYSR
jgi:hypothetical protein